MILTHLIGVESFNNCIRCNTLVIGRLNCEHKSLEEQILFGVDGVLQLVSGDILQNGGLGRAVVRDPRQVGYVMETRSILINLFNFLEYRDDV